MLTDEAPEKATVSSVRNHSYQKQCDGSLNKAESTYPEQGVKEEPVLETFNVGRSEVDVVPSEPIKGLSNEADVDSNAEQHANSQNVVISPQSI